MKKVISIIDYKQKKEEKVKMNINLDEIDNEELKIILEELIEEEIKKE